jgi:hypothetical protein
VLTNRYTSDDTWEQFSTEAQIVFNKMYEYAIKRKELTAGLDSNLSDEQWEAVVHNMSILAALCVDGHKLIGPIVEDTDYDLPSN